MAELEGSGSSLQSELESVRNQLSKVEVDRKEAESKAEMWEVCVCVYVCVCVCIYACTHMHVSMHMCVVCICTCIFVYVHMYSTYLLKYTHIQYTTACKSLCRSLHAPAPFTTSPFAYILYVHVA